MSTLPPTFMSIFNQPKESVNTFKSPSNKSIKSKLTSKLKSNLNKQKRLAKAPKKTSRIGTFKRLTNIYSKECKSNNLIQLLNYKTEDWIRKKGLNGDIYNTKLEKVVLKSGDKAENYLDNIVDKNFPETIHDHFTHSIFDYDFNLETDTFIQKPKLKKEILLEGNVVQFWKLLDKKGVNRHVCCIIWHENKPYSFSFDGDDTDESDGGSHPNLSLKSPSFSLEVTLIRELNRFHNSKSNPHKKTSKFIELLAIGYLDNHMIQELIKILDNETNKYDGNNINVILSGFEDIDTDIQLDYKIHKDELNLARHQWVNYISEKAIKMLNKKRGKISEPPKEPSEYSYNATLVLPELLEIFDKKPFQLTFTQITIIFKDFRYCRRDSGRKSNRKNCMGALDTIFQDIFSCRLFGTYILPKLCGPKKKCFSVNDTDTAVLESNNLFSNGSTDTTHLVEIPNTVVEAVNAKAKTKMTHIAALGKRSIKKIQKKNTKKKYKKK